MKYLTFYILILLFLYSCKQLNSDVTDKKITYKELSKGFYLGSDNKMYIQTASVDDEGKGEGFGPIFFRDVPDIDIATFENLGTDGWYAKDKKKVYIDHFMTDGRHLWLLDSADAGTFEVIGYRWGKDKNHVFENGIILEGLDPDSMIILCPDTTEFKQVFFSMVRDRQSVYYGHELINGVHVPTFECICTDSVVTYRDKYWIYNENYFPNMDSTNRTKR